MKNRTIVFWEAVLGLSLMALPLAAQNAAVVGTVKDPQQAAIPDASVTLTNLDTGVSVNTKTDAAGNYEFAFVKPGSYSLKAEQKGFQTYVASRFPVAVDERVRIDPAVQLGEASTLVTVAENAIGVQTES